MKKSKELRTAEWPSCIDGKASDCSMVALNNKQSANLRDEIIHWINGLFVHSHRHLLSTYSVPGSE